MTQTITTRSTTGQRAKAVVPTVLPAAPPKEGFPEILAELRARFRRPVPLDGLADGLFTLGSRQQRAFGFAALSREEAQLYELLRVQPVVPFDRTKEAPSPQTLLVGMRATGRVYLEFCGPSMSIDEDAFGSVSIPPFLMATAEDIVRRALRERATDAAPALAFFRDANSSLVADVIEVVKHAIDHIDPVIIHVHRDTFTNYGRFNNLLGRMSEPVAGLLIDDLMSGRQRVLSLEEREFLYCFYVLKVAGFRGEEFSGKQLTCPVLFDYLHSKLRDFAALTGNPLQPPAENLVECAGLCKSYKEALRKTHFVSRRINGLSFHKDELYMLRSSVDLSCQAIPSAITEYVSRTHGLKYCTGNIDQYFTKAVAAMACAPEQTFAMGLSPLEDLLRVVVETAIEELESSIGMSRGFRDLLRWQRAIVDSQTQVLIDCPTTDYYCAVFTSERCAKQLKASPGRYKRIATAIATRMTFNSWHYTPGQFAQPNSDGSRHYYHPPRMSDRADWSDQHHTGHVQAGVRYSIRSPASLELAGRKQYGMIDLRLMREESPCSDGELVRAREYTAYLRALFQAVANWTFASGSSMPVCAFDKTWYAERDSET